MRRVAGTRGRGPRAASRSAPGPRRPRAGTTPRRRCRATARAPRGRPRSASRRGARGRSPRASRKIDPSSGSGRAALICPSCARRPRTCHRFASEHAPRLGACPSCPRWKPWPSTSGAGSPATPSRRSTSRRSARSRPSTRRCARSRALLVDDVTRHGKFLDIERRRAAPGHAPGPRAAGSAGGRGADAPAAAEQQDPLAARVVLDDQSGLDITEAGTKKSLAIYVVRDPQDVPGIARLGPDPLDRRLHPRAVPRRSSRPRAASSSRACCATRAPSPASATPTPTRSCTPRGCRRSSRPASLLDADDDPTRDPVRRHPRSPSATRSSGRAGWPPASSRARRSPTSPCTGGPASPARSAATPCARCRFADSSLQYCPTCQTGGKPLADRRMSKLLK